MRAHRSTPWAAAFIVLLLLSAGMFSAPTSADSVTAARSVYVENATVVVVSQVVGLLAAAVFLRFAWVWAETAPLPSSRRIRAAGTATALAAGLTAVPPLWLAAVAADASDAWVDALVHASDLTDVVLFASISVFAAVAGASLDGTARLLGWGIAGVEGARALLLLTGTDVLGVVAPLAFLVLVAGLPVLSARRRVATLTS